MLIDTHAHLYSDKFKDDIDSVIELAKETGIKKIILPNIDRSSTSSMHQLVERYPGLCLPCMGVHPCSIKENYKEELHSVEQNLAENKYYGIGETGIDLYWDETFKKEQIYAFERQIELSKEYDLPIIIHSRDALDLTIDLIANQQDGALRGVFHCFNGTEAQAKKIQDVDFYMGLGGVVTFKKANLGDVVRYISQDYILLETDAPYLAPTPYRGKRNQSAYIEYVAKTVSVMREQNLDNIQAITTDNATRLFRLN